jgi:hypothetical protein
MGGNTITVDDAPRCESCGGREHAHACSADEG